MNLSSMTRDELRAYAKSKGVPRGRDKSDTLRNLQYYHKHNPPAPTYYKFTNSEGKSFELRGDLTIEDMVRMGLSQFRLVPKGTKPESPNHYIESTPKRGGKILRGYTGKCPNCGTTIMTRVSDGRTKSINRNCTVCGRSNRLKRNKMFDRFHKP